MKALIVLLLAASLGLAQPLATAPTGADRWRNYSRDAFLSPGAFFASVIPGTNEHWSNRPPEYGQGWGAFGERVGRRAAQYQVQMALFHGSAAALRTQTKYTPCECGGGWRRTRHALSRTLLTRTDGGATVVNAPLLGGYLAGGMIATSWYPERYSPWREGLRTGGAQLGGRTALNLVREFAPELKRLVRWKR
jgi:hypothetical protein